MLENGMLAGKVAARADRAWVGGWLVSPSWDVLWILNGIPLALIFLLLGSLLEPRPLLQGTAFVLTAVLWGGHNLSPMVAAWSNTDFRTHMLGRRGRFLWFPLALWVAATVVGFLAGSQLTRLAAPDGFGPAAPGPKDHLNGIIALAYVYLVWNQWHFCGQQFGVLTIYRRRQAGAFDPVERAWDRWYCVIFGMVLVPSAWLLNDNSAFQHLSFYLPPVDRSLSRSASVGLAVVSAVLATLVVLRELRKPRRSVARLGYVITVGTAPIVAALASPIVFLAVWATNHWSTAIALASRIVGNASRPANRPAPRLLALVTPAVAMMAVSIPLVLLLVVQQDAMKATDGFVTLRAVTPFLGAVIGFRYGFAFVHFLYDRSLYSFSSPAVRTTISPLLFAVSPSHWWSSQRRAGRHN
jgi:hypothetical protein